MADTEKAEDGAADDAAPSTIKSKLKLIIAAVGVLAILGAGAGWVFFMRHHGEEAHAEAPPPKPPSFIEVPDMMVNLAGAPGDRVQYLKVKITLEVKEEKQVEEIKPTLPRVTDIFQTYLRELRPSDFNGSAGLYRMKEELTRRVNAAGGPYQVSAGLVKEVVVQGRGGCRTMAGKDKEVDQDAIAAQWEASLDSEDPTEAAEAAAANELSGTMALQWAAMVEDGGREFGGGKNGGERVLSQEEIDNLLGFNVGDVNVDDNSGIRAIIDSAMVSYERLPMLEIVFDCLVRLMTTSLRNFTSDNVEVSLDRITSVRFGDYMNSIPLPAVLSVFKAEEWENFGLATVDSSLIYSIIDVLLGGRRGQASMRIEGRPYTTIETNLVKRLVEVVLADAEQAFRPLSPVTFSIDRLETNPRFAAISRPANAAILVRLHIDMEDRGGNIELLLPYATIEPIRSVLLQMFMGEKFGRDPIWEGHFATEVAQAQISVDAVLYEADIPLKQLMKLKVGDTLPLDMRADALVSVRCGSVTLTEGRMGRVGDRVAIRVTKPLRKPSTTLAMFEKVDEQNKMMEAP